MLPRDGGVPSKRNLPNGIAMLQNKQQNKLFKPNSLIRSVPQTPKQAPDARATNRRKYSVLLRKPSTKKNPQWETDGKLIVPSAAGEKVILRDDDGVLLAQQHLDRGKIKLDGELKLGEWEVLIDAEDQSPDSSAKPPVAQPKLVAPVKPVMNVVNISDDDEGEDDFEVIEMLPKTRFEALYRKPGYNSKTPYSEDGEVVFENGKASLRNAKGKVLGSLNINKVVKDDRLKIAGKEVLIGDVVNEEEKKQTTTREVKLQPTTLSTFSNHKPKYQMDNDAVVLPRVQGKDIIDVVVDPQLGRKLRPHQIDGVKFLYECVMGIRRVNGGKGALLADEMGLGKTLMTISLIWTLLNQNPVKGGRPVVRRALVACPVTLLHNWKAEFERWLGIRVKVFVMDDKQDVGTFKYSRCHVMLIGYERLRLVQDELKKCSFDLIVCDEAQKLKKVDSQVTKAIIGLGVEKRVMLSGTPIQNNLSEFYAMAEVLNPGLLGSASEFKRRFEDPIMKGRDATATQKLKVAASVKLKDLTEITSGFVLRRTNELIADTLPSRTDVILFCRPTAKQAAEYKLLVNSSNVWDEIDELVDVDVEKKQDLGTMTKLKKICNSPALLNDDPQSRFDALDSGKMAVLKGLLIRLKTTTQEKVVIVSQFTKTLDLIQQMLGQLGMSNMRLDGSTATANRQQLVDQFNQTSQEQRFVFMTSTRSGGAGINLIGASRLILFDCDWNPSWDNQAMARIHRMGQKLPVFIYRLLTTGCIDECIFQRQITKQGLADQFMDADGAASCTTASNSFTKEELRDIFTFHDDTLSHTHDLLGCECLKDQPTLYADSFDDEEEGELGGFMTASSVSQNGVFVPKALRPETKMQGLLNYSHYATDLTNLGDPVLVKAINNSQINMPVSFIMKKCNK